MSGNDFVKGRTNNHLSWVMVDATDFATPESALSAAMKIKIYGKVRGATGVNFVSSGTGSLTNDIQHVGASVLGMYTIALAKPDLSDASNAWYDQYEIALSATGAAYQVLIVDGGIDVSALLAAAALTQSYASDTYSAALLAQSYASDAHSAAVLGASRALLVQSRLSDLDSRLVSDVSDILSAIGAVAADTSTLSDIQSYLVAMSGMLSDTHSAAILGASHASDAYSAALLIQSRLSDLDSRLVSDTSDIYSALLLTQSLASDAHSAAAQGNSRVLLVQSRLSDLDSRLVSDFSDVMSNVTAVGALATAASSRALLAQSYASDAYSAAVLGASRALLVQSRLSDLDSALSNLKESVKAIGYGTVDGTGATTTAFIASALSPATAVNDQPNGRVLIFKNNTTTAALRGQATTISDFVHATQTFTVVALTTPPVTGDSFVVL